MSRTSWRLKAVVTVFIFFIGLIISRLFYWQVIKADQFAIAALKQHLDYFPIPANRGQILASDGFPLVANEEVFLIFATPASFEEETNSIAAKLGTLLLTEDEEREAGSRQSALLKKETEIKERLSRPDSVWIPLQHKISRQVRENIENLQIPGIGFESQQKRTYPEGTASAYLLGFLGSDRQGQDQGYFGLEGYYDLELRGREGLIKREKDASGKPILVGSSYKEEKRDGRDLITTLDRTAQFIIEEKLEKAMDRYGAIGGSVILMDPIDGAIMAAVSLPTYDPSAYASFKEESFPNPVIASSYEPGSAFKILVMAAAINEEAVELDTKCPICAGPREISGYLINTWDDQYHPDSTVTDILVHSDNVGMVFVAEQLKIEKFLTYLDRFGFGQPTGVDLQDEDVAPLRPGKEWGEIDLATASFGQGIAVTRLQMIRAAATIANGGLLVKPYLVRGMVDLKETQEMKLVNSVRVMKPSSAKAVTQMMVEAVNQGEAKWAKPEGFKIAGKTGTAQIPVAGHYEKEKTIASFIGFAPADNPRFIMLVTLREPTSSPWGSETAAPLWFEISKELFTYYKIMPQ